jgi:homoserine O-acetyltransferase
MSSQLAVPDPVVPPPSPPPARSRAFIPDFEISGRQDAPVIVALGGISAGKHVAANHGNHSPGWWDSVVGVGKSIDPARHCILSFDYLDGGAGADGRPARVVTTHDQAAALRRALDTLGIRRIRAIIGSSYGGMVALAFAERYPTRVAQLVVISAAHESHPMSTALRSVQRRIVEMGLDAGRAGDALALARALAMTTYRGEREFAERFSSRPVSRTESSAVFPVERYLEHCAARATAVWRPDRFLALSLSTDLHRVDPASIRTPAVLVAAEGDRLVPPEQMQALSDRLGAPNQLVHLPTACGHDAFLTEPSKIGAIIHNALNGALPND